MDHVSHSIEQDVYTVPSRSQTQHIPLRKQIRLNEPFAQSRFSYGSVEDNPVYIMMERRPHPRRQQLSHDKDSISPRRRSGSESMIGRGKASGRPHSTRLSQNWGMSDDERTHGMEYWRLHASRREVCNSEDCPLILRNNLRNNRARPSREGVVSEGYVDVPCLNGRQRMATDSFLSDHNHTRKLARHAPMSSHDVCFILPSDRVADHNFDTDHVLRILEHQHVSGPLLLDSWCIRTRSRRISPYKHEARSRPTFHIAYTGYDGASSDGSRRSASDQGLLEIESPHRQSRRDRRRRPTFATEGFSTMFRQEDPLHDGFFRKLALTFPGRAQTKARGRCGNRLQQLSKSTSCPPTPQGSRARPQLQAYFSSARQSNLVYNSEYLEIPTLHKTSSHVKARPMITSEAHPVFIQPVRELIIRRWQIFRGRFNHERKHSSREAAVRTITPGSLDTDRVSMPEATPCSPGSPHARARRRLARERGEIQSSDMGSSPQIDDSESLQLTGVDTPLWLDSPISTPVLEHTDPLAAAAALVNADPRRDHDPDPTASTVTPICPPNTLATTTPSGNSLPGSTPPSRSSENSFAGEIRDRRSPPYSPRGRRNMKQQRSRLSEVYSPDCHEDVEERNALSAVGSAIHSPCGSPHPVEQYPEAKVSNETRWFQPAELNTSEFPEQAQSAVALLANLDGRISAVQEKSEEEKDGQDRQTEMEADDEVPLIRQGIVRTSTTGTQIHRRDAWDMKDDSD